MARPRPAAGSRLALAAAAACLLRAPPPPAALAGPAAPGAPPARRAAALAGLVAAGVPASATAEGSFEPSGALRAASGLASAILGPIYAVEAPLQAGGYDRAAVRARIEREVRASPVVVYSYTLSPFCAEAKELLASLGARYEVVELAPEWLPGMLPPEGAAVRAELGAMTGQTSMPHVFIGGESVGGLFTGTPGLVPLLEAGRLRERLAAAGAL